ncbi:MAG: 2Fe-2S iron-sulfur cluster-binding protein, partial [Myxococcota bacterium]
GRTRPVYFVHGARSGRAHAFGPHIRALAARHTWLSAHICYSQPEPGDVLGRDYESRGRIDIDLLKQVLPFDDYDFYLCGPQLFMQDLYDGLTGLNVHEERIRYEAFGPATVRRRTVESTPEPAPQPDELVAPPDRREAADGAAIAVRFAESDVSATWTAEHDTLLDLAESLGLDPLFSCREGECGTCATRMICGAVHYDQEPMAAYDDDEVLLCCARRPPAGERDEDSAEIVLEL